MNAALLRQGTSETVLSLPVETTVVLLRYGLQVQRQRQKEIENLAAAVIDAASGQEAAQATDRLGETIFGK